jgi:hypothetical protein
MTNLLQHEKLLTTAMNADVICKYEITDTTRARLAIDINCSEEIKTDMVNKITAPDMLAYLVGKYEGKSNTRKLKFIKEMVCFSFNQFENVEKAVQGMEQLLRQLITANGSKTIQLEDISVALLCNALPDQFKSLRTLFENQEKLALKVVKEKLLAADQSLSLRKESSGFTSATVTPPNRRHCQHGYNRDVCWTCDPKNHWSKLKCKDCHQTGHRSRTSTRCNMHANGKDKHGSAHSKVSSLLKKMEKSGLAI